MRETEYTKISREVPTPIISRYYSNSLLEEEGVVFRETYTPKEIPVSDSDKYTQVTANEVGRPDLLALRMYKNPKLYWYILQANDIVDPVSELTVGKVLRIPNSGGVVVNAA